MVDHRAGFRTRPLHSWHGRLWIPVHDNSPIPAKCLGEDEHAGADHSSNDVGRAARRRKRSRRAGPMVDGRDYRLERNPLWLARLDASDLPTPDSRLLSPFPVSLLFYAPPHLVLL